MLTVLTNLTPDVYVWRCTIWMTLFAVSRKWSVNSEQVFINQRNFQPSSIGKHNSIGNLLPCAIDFKTNHPLVHLQWIGKLGIATEPRHFISMGPRNWKWPVRPLSAATSSVWRTLMFQCTWCSMTSSSYPWWLQMISWHQTSCSISGDWRIRDH